MYQFPATLHMSLVVVSCINVCVLGVFCVMCRPNICVLLVEYESGPRRG